MVELEGGRSPAALALVERGTICSRSALAMVANLPRKIATRELDVVKRELSWSRDECRVVELDGRGPGNALCLVVETEAVTEVVTAFGDKGVAAEAVAGRAVAELQAWLDAGVPVGEHLADQLLDPDGARGPELGELPHYIGATPSLHTTTNAAIIGRFLPVEFAFEPNRRGPDQGHRPAVSPEPGGSGH